MSLFNKNNLLIYFTVLVSIFFLALLWDSISLPFKDVSHASSYIINKKINPHNDTLRYCLFVGIPLFLYILASFLIKTEQNNFTLNDANNYESYGFINGKVLIIINILILFILFDFFGSPHNFKASSPQLDGLHDGDYLTPVLNFFETGGLWSSSATVHGGADFIYPILLWKLTGLKTIGSAKIFFSILILLVKFLSVILAYQITRMTLLGKNTKVIFFTIFAFFLISLSHYNAPINYSVISYRDIFTIIFLIFFIEIFLKNKKLFQLHFAITFIAFIALLFHFDIGVYLYTLLILYTFYLLTLKQFHQFLYIYFLIGIFWAIFIYIFGTNEFYSFFDNFYLIVSSMDLAHGYSYPTPFFSIGEDKDGARATKGLLLQIFAGILILKNTIFSKNNLPKNYKVLLFFIFFLCLISYKNALGRSEAYHIRMSTDIQLLIICFFLLKSFLKVLEKKILNKKTILLFNIFPFILCLILFVDKSFDDKDIKNVFSSKDRLISYVKFEDEDFIKTAYSNPTNLRKFLKKYNELNKNENCIQNFTADIILPYLLKKPSCTKYFSSWLALSKKAQLKYIATLKVKSPKYIIYESPGFIIDKIPTHERLILVNSYIIDNYSIYETFNDYSILIKK